MNTNDKGLAKKPLIEAILEIRWRAAGTNTLPLLTGIPLQALPAGTSLPVVAIDPHYRIALARLFERFKERYPVYEQLPAANLPDDVAPHQVQHRVRASQGGWPLLQFGPGVLTVNEAASYSWESFREQCIFALKTLSEAHPEIGSIQFESIALRYVNAIDFDPKEERLFQFLRENMKLGIDIPDSMYSERVEKIMSAFICQFEFKHNRPVGRMNINMQLATKDNLPIILWNLAVYSMWDDIPRGVDSLQQWIENAHESIEEWFFKTIDGELHRRFTHE